MSCFSITSSQHDGGDEDQTIRASSSSTPSQQNYEVFLSFRGDDTRYKFTDFLYYGLTNRGIEVFRDNEELHVGEKIDKLFEAIKASKISIPIISPDYASSIWCLKELLQILECKKILGQLVLPIFYHIKPSDIREQKGTFGNKFKLCQSKHDLDGKFVKELQDAFIEVATMKGWEVNETENSRIWLEEEAKEVMQKKQGTDKVQALILEIFHDGYPYEYKEDEEKELHYRSQDFEGMPNLRFLRMGSVHLTGDFENLFLNLKWLRWGPAYLTHNYIDIMGINLNPQKLVVLELYGSNITEDWKGWSHMKDLKVIRLVQCMNLTMTPDFSTLKELEVLDLGQCGGLRRIHPSIGKFNKTLKVLNVSYCYNLKELPLELGKMEELRELDIGYTPITVPPIFKYMKKLEKLQAQHCRQLQYIPNSLGSLVKLQHLDLLGCKLVTKIPESIGKLTLLIRLDLTFTSVDELPNSIGGLRNMESLQMRNTPIKCLPTSIGMLSKLRELNLRSFKELKSLPNLPSSLMSLFFSGDSMETFPDLSYLTNLKSLEYTDMFARRNRALNLGYLNQLETLWIKDGDFEGTQEESKILDVVKELDLALENFSLHLELPVSLLKLEVYGCQTLHMLPNFSNFKNLSELSLEFCSELMEINGLRGVESLIDLMVRGCRKLSRLGDLSHLKRLRNIELSDCEKLSDVQGIENLTSLTRLTFSQCHPKIKFPDLSMLTNLKDLSIEDKKLMEILGLQELKSLKFLDISGCKSLQHLPDLSQCTNLEKLVLKDCEKLIEIQGLENLMLLKELDIKGCFALLNLPILLNVKIKSDPNPMVRNEQIGLATQKERKQVQREK